MKTDILILVAMMAGPGVGAGLVAYGPRTVAIPTRLALSLGLGYAWCALAAYVLALGGALTSGALLAAILTSTSVLWIAGLRRGRWREHLPALGEELRECKWELLVGFSVIVYIAVQLDVDPLLNLPGVASFRYWGDALEIAELGRFPDLSLQYGALYPVANSKVLLNSFTAATTLLVGNDPLSGLSALLWTTAIGMALALWAAARELGLRVTAPLLPLLTVLNHSFHNAGIATDLDIFRAETPGRMVAFAALAAGARALGPRSGWGDVVVLAVLATAGAGTHLIPVIVVAVALAGYGLARLLFADRRWDLVRKASAAVGITAVLAVPLLLFSPGEVGFEGAGRTTSYRDVTYDFDPTRYLLHGDISKRPLEAKRTDFIVGFARTALGDQGRTLAAAEPTTLRYGLVIGGLVVAVGMLLFFPRPLKPIGLTAWVMGAALVVIATLFAQRFDNWVLTTFGTRRLADYSSMPVLLVGLAVIEACAFWARLRPAVAALGVGALVVVIAALAPPRAADERQVRRSAQGPVALSLLEWVTTNTPCDARFLVNQRTTGVFKVMTGRVALLEGMTPYLRPEMLNEVVGVLRRGQLFFQAPEGRARFLRANGIDYVVQLRGLRLGHGLVGTSKPISVDNLEPVYEDDTYATIFRVEPRNDRRPSDRDQPTGPGYLCRRGALTTAMAAS
jgi:hypothetical protein